MKRKRSGAALSVVVASVLVLSACGSDDNTTSSSVDAAAAASVQCGGKNTLKGSGSTAQANAMARFIAVYQAVCAGKNLNYTSNGSGAGVTEFVGKQTDFGGSDSPLSAAKGEPARAAARCGSPAWNCRWSSVPSRSPTPCPG